MSLKEDFPKIYLIIKILGGGVPPHPNSPVFRSLRIIFFYMGRKETMRTIEQLAALRDTHIAKAEKVRNDFMAIVTQKLEEAQKKYDEQKQYYDNLQLHLKKFQKQY